MLDFAHWLAQTRISLAIQTHFWVIPTVQSIHIVAIGIVLSSVFMMDLRVWGWAGTDQTLGQMTRRFAPWLWGALGVLLVTGVVMVVGEPVRELLSLSFWLKMSLILVGSALAAGFQLTLGRSEREWDESSVSSWTTRVLATVTFLVWCSIVVLGRLIAYDYVWGRWSLAPIT
jgi:putative copper export protein